VSDERFGPRLRLERERRQIALSSIASNTKISAAFFEALERDDVSRWPSGIFRRSFIRAYAVAIGLDADEVTREFLERFPDPDRTFAPVPAAGPPAPADTPRQAAAAGLRLTLADPGLPFTGGSLLASTRNRWAAVTWDLGVILVVGAALFLAVGSFWTTLCVSMLGYYAGGILLLGNTPGVCLLAPVHQPASASTNVATEATSRDESIGLATCS
jgi:hypothetical protein